MHKTKYRLIIATEECTCAGKKNEYNEGAECANYSEYSDPWLNGVWCYADITTCSDARAHEDTASEELKGYAASRDACVSGIFHNKIYFVLIIYIYRSISNLPIQFFFSLGYMIRIYHFIHHSFMWTCKWWFT